MGRRFYIGDRVLFIGDWNSFRGQCGQVTAISPYLLVRVDGESAPMRFMDHEVARIEPSETNLTGAE